MYISTYICIYYIYLCICTYTYVYVYIPYECMYISTYIRMCVCVYIYVYICVCICIYIHSKIHQFAILKYFCTNSKTDQSLNFNLYRELSFLIRWYSRMLHFPRNLLYFKHHLKHDGVNHQVIRYCHIMMAYPNTGVIQDHHVYISTARTLCGMMNGVEKGIQE